VILLSGSIVSAEPPDDGLAHVFTSSVVEVTGDRNAVLTVIQSDVVSRATNFGQICLPRILGSKSVTASGP
jgi:hypothetical protein